MHRLCRKEEGINPSQRVFSVFYRVLTFYMNIRSSFFPWSSPSNIFWIPKYTYFWFENWNKSSYNQHWIDILSGMQFCRWIIWCSGKISNIPWGTFWSSGKNCSPLPPPAFPWIHHWSQLYLQPSYDESKKPCWIANCTEFQIKQ